MEAVPRGTPPLRSYRRSTQGRLCRTCKELSRLQLSACLKPKGFQYNIHRLRTAPLAKPLHGSNHVPRSRVFEMCATLRQARVRWCRSYRVALWPVHSPRMASTQPHNIYHSFACFRLIHFLPDRNRRLRYSLLHSGCYASIWWLPYDPSDEHYCLSFVLPSAFTSRVPRPSFSPDNKDLARLGL